MDPKKPKQALNADAITEVLLRLPAKSVCRFRSVSKRWLSDLSSPHFIRSQPPAPPAAPSGFYLHDPYERQAEFYSLNGGGGGRPDPTLSFLDYRGIPPEPVDSCNGLILCRLPKRFQSKPFALSVCNPTTREHEVIPLSYDMRGEIMAASLRLAFDPRRSPHYMIFAMVSVISTFHLIIYKYASETRSWKLLEVGMMMPWPPSVYWNRSFVWFQYPNKLAALDVEGEQIQDLLLPPPRKTKKFLHLAVSGERLHYIRGQNQTQFEILEMTPMSSEWHVLHRVDLGSIKHLFEHRIYNIVVEFFRGDDDRLLLRMPNKIVSYHIQQKTSTTICQIKPGMHRYVILPLARTLSPLIVSRVDAPPIQEWVSWKSVHDQLLMNMMVEHSRNGKKIKNGFRIDAWREMVRMFNQATRLNYDVCHLENRLKSYKREYKTVKKILAIDGFHWDPSEKVVNASAADWQKLFKSKPKALVYKRKHVLFEDLRIICASSVHIDSVVSQTLAANERADKISID